MIFLLYDIAVECIKLRAEGCHSPLVCVTNREVIL